MERRVNDAGTYRVVSDVLRRELARQMPREIVHECFGGTVDTGSAATAVKPGNGADIDDRAAPATVHVGYSGLTRLNDRSGIQIEHRVQPGIIGLEKRAPTDKRTCVVDQYVKALQGFSALLHDAPGDPGTRKITLNEVCSTAGVSNVLGHPLRGSCIGVPVHRDTGSLLRERAADRCADTGFRPWHH